MGYEEDSKRFNNVRTPFVWCVLLSFHFGGETWWAQCATRKSIKLHMLCSLCCCVARHERPFWIPGTRFLSGFSFDCIDICNRFRLAPRTLIIWCLVVRVRKMRVKAQPNAASKVHKTDLRFYRKIKLMEMAYSSKFSRMKCFTRIKGISNPKKVTNYHANAIPAFPKKQQGEIFAGGKSPLGTGGNHESR